MARNVWTPRQNSVPEQLIPRIKKNEEWRKRNVDSAESLGGVIGNTIRRDRLRKIINYRLWDGFIDKTDIIKYISPDNQLDETLANNLQHHPILHNKFNVLIGEELSRPFVPEAIITSEDAISEAQLEKRKYIEQEVMRILQSSGSDDQKRQMVAALQKKAQFEFKDYRTSMVNKLLRYMMYTQDWAGIFNDGMKDVILAAEEVYRCDIVGNEPKLERLNPANLYTPYIGQSSWHSDSDIIIYEEYKSPGQILDEFHDELTKEEMKDLLSLANGGNSKVSDFVDMSQASPIFAYEEVSGTAQLMNGMIEISETMRNNNFGPYQDTNGNLRVLRVWWRSFFELQKVFYPDETGVENFRYEPDWYVVDKSRGEHSTKIIGSEWWEGHKIGQNVYKRMRPKPVQFRNMSNPAECHSGIVGRVYNTNQGPGISIMDLCKPYQYLYDIVWDKLKDDLKANLGPIMEMDFAKVPQGWTPEKWGYYMRKMRIAATDSFKESTKGASKGKLAGNFNTTGRVLNLDTGNMIQSKIQMLEFIEYQLSLITGVNKPKEGQTKASETATAIQQNLYQSSLITEPLYYKHDQLKLKVCKMMIELAKHAYRNNKIKRQYILPTGEIEILDLDGAYFCESDYDVVMMNAKELQSLNAKLEGLAQAFVQNEKAGLSLIMDMFTATTVQEKRRAIDAAEAQIEQKYQQEQQATKEQFEQKLQADTQDKEADRELKDRINIRDNETKLQIAGEGVAQRDRKDQTDYEVKMSQLMSDNERLVQQMEKMKVELSKAKSPQK